MNKKHCWKCKGTGNYEENTTCPLCGGAGRIMHIFPEEIHVINFDEFDENPNLLSTVSLKGYY